MMFFDEMNYIGAVEYSWTVIIAEVEERLAFPSILVYLLLDL
jgi:hypothetical protein